MTDLPTPVSPKDTILYNNKYKFTCRLLGRTEFMCTQANIPGITGNTFQQPNSLNHLIVGGTKVEYEDLNITFIVDVNLKNYRELFDWIVAINAPEDFEQHNSFVRENTITAGNELIPEYNIYSDATLFTLNNAHNLNLMLTFRDLFPYSLSGLDFENKANAPITARASFKYLNYVFEDTTLHDSSASQ